MIETNEGKYRKQAALCELGSSCCGQGFSNMGCCAKGSSCCSGGQCCPDGGTCNKEGKCVKQGKIVQMAGPREAERVILPSLTRDSSRA
ncbi:hypothetical protein FGO68_gene9059 [Halteria grandinella]|uniref:Granulins domain-containing protein n=1 Tax=Halteria grandinella TaxID=5974 RepID=A0A8J8NZF6_HALGN|nr:hypothetical protein FGO68_gene9059 [Halteria grandinella]